MLIQHETKLLARELRRTNKAQRRSDRTRSRRTLISSQTCRFKAMVKSLVLTFTDERDKSEFLTRLCFWKARGKIHDA